MSAQLQVEHCPSCGKVYQKNLRNLCSACTQQYDRELTLCFDYLRRDRKADNDRLSGGTGLPPKRIIQFIMDRRLSLYDYPNLCYYCELCRTPIRSEKLCYSCRTRISEDISKMQEEEQRRKPPSSHTFKVRDR